MQKPIEFYTQEQAKYTAECNNLKQEIKKISLVRLLIFLASAYLIYVNFSNVFFASSISILGLSSFLFFVLKSNKLKRKQNIANQKILINTTEIAVLQNNFHHLETGNEFTNSNHFFSNDIDLFGEGSFFQYINRTATQRGKKALAHLLLANDIDNIVAKQTTLQELSTKVKWRQHFLALAGLTSVKEEAEETLNWVKQYTATFKKQLHLLPKAFSVISLALIALIALNILSFSILTFWFFLGVFLSVFHIKKTNTIYTEANKIKDTVKQYYVLLHLIETENFLDKQLKIQQENTTKNQKKASAIVKQFSKILDSFDQRNNIIIAVFGNGLFLWDIKNACATENWLLTYKNTVQNWFDVVAFFDAQNSLANFIFNNPDYVFPEITSSKKGIEAKNLGHPLLNETKRVDNNFSIQNSEFYIITGANMAGKSTFLRTVSLSIVMANVGLPVCATQFTYAPIKLLTSMRTLDSLKDNESYFYSELKRLKFIVDTLNTDNYFIILDEILKGTNSKDKAIGSKKFVKKLTHSNATGIIATHDISLCELADEFENIANYYFDAEIINNELHFDYTLKHGVCKNMNASFLLEKMEIVD